MKIQLLLTSLLLSTATGAAFTASAAVPQGYYSTCENKSGAALLTALNNKISAHNVVSYKGLLDLYKSTDVKPNGKIWDMYSTKEWNPGESCGNYSQVGDCYNREHSFPKSWFNDASPMYSDAFHIYPTDGKVNGQRSNYPYGECANGTTLPSHNGIRALGKLGRSTFAGYSRTVFEPVDEYKGDFARSYFYMIACYNDRITGWKSDMLSGNKYPGLSTWAVNLLLKWHRQDPVSDKEKNRNEAVYARQNNRNPFIDYPDLAEHIWGDEKSTPWTSTGEVKPSISTPVNGSVIDLGYAATGKAKSTTITVKGLNVKDNVSVTVSGAGFSASASTLSASAVNSTSGAPLTVSYTSSAATKSTGTLTLRTGSAVSTVTLRAEAVSGIPVSEPVEITSESFTFTWVNVDAAGTDYNVTVLLGNETVEGYPRKVSAAAERFTATGLMPETTYSYRVSSATLTSATKTVTTGQIIPSIAFLYDGDLYFSTQPGVPSEPAEVMIDTENIGGDITVSVTAPFQLSLDKTDWLTSIVLTPDQDRFYMRLNSSAEGDFSTTLKAQAGDYIYDDVTVQGIASSSPDFVETFEADNKTSGYYTGTIQGSACLWDVHTVFFNSNAGEAREGTRSIRFGKAGNDSYISMAQDKSHGAGEVKFYAKAWSSTETGKLALEYSTDGGRNWTTVRTFDVTSPNYTLFSAPVNVSGDIRLRFDRTDGGRVCLDDITVANYAGHSGVADLEYHAWDAYARGGSLIIETRDSATLHASVYGMDGIAYYNAGVTGQATLPLEPGLYIVVINDYARRVLVR